MDIPMARPWVSPSSMSPPKRSGPKKVSFIAKYNAASIDYGQSTFTWVAHALMRDVNQKQGPKARGSTRWGGMIDKVGAKVPVGCAHVPWLRNSS
jgi:hypothetical protein